MDISSMVGKTFVSVTEDSDTITFVADDGIKFVFNHHQSCCESVGIESIVGDLQDLVGEPLLRAEEVTSYDNPTDYDEKKVHPYGQDSFTWTFYKFATRKGYVDVRWYGESNGYYSEEVDLDITNAAGQYWNYYDNKWQ